MPRREFNLTDLDGRNGLILQGIDAGDHRGNWPVSLPLSKNSMRRSIMVGRVFELSNLNGVNGFTIDGIVAGDASGYSVSAAGDVNGDGIGDLVIGAYKADPNGENIAGQSYLVFGKRTAWDNPLELWSLNGSNGVIINGITAGDSSGYSVSAAGDVNGDGIADLLIGAYRASPSEKSEAGQTYLIFGKQPAWTSPLELSSLNGSNGVIINGIAEHDQSGYSVSVGLDINGDGIDDLMIGAIYAAPDEKIEAGQSYLVFGKQTPWTSPLELSSLNGSNGVIINGIITRDYSGSSVSAAGDVNGDGVKDLMIGAFQANPNEKNDAGQSYLIFGKRTVWDNPLELSSLNGTNGVIINGIAIGDVSGWSVAAVGDVNGDGFGDVMIGAIYADPNGETDAGQSYLIFGKQMAWDSPLELSSLNGTNGVIINGIAAGDGSGVSVSAVGDVNEDGIADLIIGAPIADPNGKNESGQSYLIFGRRTVWNNPLELSSLNGSNGVIINGIAVGDNSGISISAAGDVNGDGIADLVIGAYKADPNGRINAGQNYVVFGGAEQFSANQIAVRQGESVILNVTNIAVAPNIDSRIFNVTEVSNGHFALTSNTLISIFSFNQSQINSGEITFVSDGSDQAPRYVVSADGITRVFSDVRPQAGNISFSAPTFMPTASPSYVPSNSPTRSPTFFGNAVTTPTVMPSQTSSTAFTQLLTTIATTLTATQEPDSGGSSRVDLIVIISIASVILGIIASLVTIFECRKKTENTILKVYEAGSKSTVIIQNPAFDETAEASGVARRGNLVNQPEEHQYAGLPAHLVICSSQNVREVATYDEIDNFGAYAEAGDVPVTRNAQSLRI